MLKELELVTVNELLAVFIKKLRGTDKSNVHTITMEILGDYFRYCQKKLNSIDKGEESKYIKDIRTELLFQNNVWMNTILVLSKNYNVIETISSFVQLVYQLSPTLGALCWPDTKPASDISKILEESKLREHFEESLKEKLGGEKANIDFTKDAKSQYVNSDLQEVWLTFKRKYNVSKTNSQKAT